MDADATHVYDAAAAERHDGLGELRADIRAALAAGRLDEYRELCHIYADHLEIEQGDPIKAATRRRMGDTARMPGLAWPRARDVDGISDHQRDQLARCFTRSIGLLTGQPGTGKTHTAARLLRAIVARHGSTTVAVCAPTGKAAVRITQAMRGHGVPIQAGTIHQLLEIGRNGHDGQGWGFRRCETLPLEQRFVVCDEMSMADTDLAAALLRACGPGTHLLWIGDPHQLPPVGHGAPLRDMIAAGVPCARLTEIRRNAGAIVEACRAIKDGDKFIPHRWGDKHDGHSHPSNLVMMERADHAGQLAALGEAMACLPPDADADPMDDVQVIVAVNKGPLGRDQLNAHLQDRLNPAGGRVPGNPYRVGDKIICLKNGWYGAVEIADGDDATSPAGDVYVANGELGRVLQVEDRRTVAAFGEPPRIISIPNYQRDQARQDDGGDVSERAGSGGDEFALGYAITGHKSQGSEWPLVVVVIDPSPGARLVCSREWLYTAISRASGLCVLVGREGVAQMMVRRPQLGRRRTFLAERIRHGGD